MRLHRISATLCPSIESFRKLCRLIKEAQDWQNITRQSPYSRRLEEDGDTCNYHSSVEVKAPKNQDLAPPFETNFGSNCYKASQQDKVSVLYPY